MKIYIDNEFKCHITNPDGIFREAETSFFDGKCHEFIEGYRYIPEREILTPWKPYSQLYAAQRMYELERLTDAENALAIMMGGVTA